MLANFYTLTYMYTIRYIVSIQIYYALYGTFMSQRYFYISFKLFVCFFVFMLRTTDFEFYFNYVPFIGNGFSECGFDNSEKF